MVDIKPYIISDETASGRALVPLPVRDKAFEEGWLQELLFQHPNILPVDYLDESFAPLISLGREIGNIDNLFVSPSGSITVVETKLWRNPEAHRTVVAQILEYAKMLTSWTYDDLNKAVSSYMSKRYGEAISIYELVKKATRVFDMSDVEYQARVQEYLQTGRFALLIVGDRIYPEATQLVDIIQSAPHLQFSMGFVELRCFRLERGSDWPLVVVPNFLTKTKEVTRAVVRVLYEEKRPDVEIGAAEEGIDKPASRVNLPIFISSLPSNIRGNFNNYLERWMKTPGYTTFWGKVGFSLRILWRGKLTTLFEAYPTYVGVLKEKWIRQCELPLEPYQKYRNDLMKSPIIGSTMAAGRVYIDYVDMTSDDIALLLQSADRLVAEYFKIGQSG